MIIFGTVVTSFGVLLVNQSLPSFLSLRKVKDLK
jgi:hypothetical protein